MRRNPLASALDPGTFSFITRNPAFPPFISISILRLSAPFSHYYLYCTRKTSSKSSQLLNKESSQCQQIVISLGGESTAEISRKSRTGDSYYSCHNLLVHFENLLAFPIVIVFSPANLESKFDFLS